MSRIYYKILEEKYLLFLCMALLPCVGICQDSTKTVNDYFNEGANKYINNKNTEALRLVQKGLAIDSSDEKLKKLAELILKKDKQQQQKQQQQQQNKQDQSKDQDKNKDQDKQNQNDKKDQEKDQQQKNQLTKEDAERMLNALNNKDKSLQDKLKDKKDSAGIMRTKVEKDW